ncbi:hypothetical protein [Angelakisella massiliensis]|uniref:hypothetical protein n=1 Tax=Angelakisella massiliensis TaxID=1871018 RepID=UPI0024B1E729|nr:hypothetical protein [Angelakisella massiliensis]
MKLEKKVKIYSFPSRKKEKEGAEAKKTVSQNVINLSIKPLFSQERKTAAGEGLKKD